MCIRDRFRLLVPLSVLRCGSVFFMVTYVIDWPLYLNVISPFDFTACQVTWCLRVAKTLFGYFGGNGGKCMIALFMLGTLDFLLARFYSCWPLPSIIQHLSYDDRLVFTGARLFVLGLVILFCVFPVCCCLFVNCLESLVFEMTVMCRVRS